MIAISPLAALPGARPTARSGARTAAPAARNGGLPPLLHAGRISRPSSRPSRGALTASAVDDGAAVAEDKASATSSFALLATMAPLAVAAPPALAEELVGEEPYLSIGGVYGLALTPIILYTIFTIYRSINPKAKFSDFALGIATTLIVGNILSILFFKVRWF